MGINQELLKLAREKVAFVPAGDPSMGGGAPPMDPAAAGGAPPMDPMAAGGAPPMDPMAAGGGGDPMAMLQPMIQQAVQAAMAQGGGGGAGGAGGGLKPKIDVNVEIMQIKKLLAKLCDAMGVHIPAQDMVATPEDLNQMAEGGPGAAAATPDSGGGGALGQIQPVEPMKAASSEEWEAGVAFTPPSSFELSHAGTHQNAEMAAAILHRMRK